MSQLAEIATTEISQVSQSKAICVSRSTTLLDVARTMREQGVSAIVIGDPSDVVGVFTERDLMLRVDQSNDAWQSKPVVDVMTPKPTMVRPTDTVDDVTNAMLVGEFRHLPVTDADGVLTGIVSIADLLEHIAEYFPDDFVNLPPDPAHEANRRWGG